MSTAVWPPIAPEQRVQAEEAALARELQWLLADLQETLASIKHGVEECVALLAPQEPGSTLVVSSMRSESVKGFLTRVGTRIVKGDIALRLATLPPRSSTSSAYALHISTHPAAPALVLQQLSAVRNLLHQALDVVDISTWTGDAHDASFIAGQLRLLQDVVTEARTSMHEGSATWHENPVDQETFDPPLPPNLSFHLAIADAALVLQLRTLAPLASPTVTPAASFPFAASLDSLSLRQRLGLAARLATHDEADTTFVFRGHEVRVREKLRVDSPDPSLLAVLAKLSALSHAVDGARHRLAVVMGVDEDEDDD